MRLQRLGKRRPVGIANTDDGAQWVHPGGAKPRLQVLPCRPSQDIWGADRTEVAAIMTAIPGEPRFNQTLTIDLRTSNSQAKNQPRPQQPPQTGTL
jgi:hypothetical protein